MQLPATFSKVLRGIFAAFLIYFAIRLLIYHYEVVSFPYSNTLREGALVATTSLLAHGINPYSMEVQPQYTNIYGIVYPAIVWPFASLWGQTLPVHRAVTGLFIFACCFVMFGVLAQKKVPFLVNASVVLMLYASLLYPGTSTPCVDPAATALLFMLLTIFIPYFLRYSYQSLVLSALFGILAFYTKLYLVLGLPIMASYLFLFVSKKKGLLYAGGAFLLFALSAVVMNAIFPCYFNNCFFVHSNYAAEWATMERLESQLKSYSLLHMGSIILVIGSLIYGLRSLIKSGQGQSLKRDVLDFPKRMQWFSFEEPLVKASFPVDIYAGICALMVLLLCLGKHGGATLWYFFQLLSPFLLMAVAQVASSISLWPIVAMPLLVFNLYSLTAQHQFHKDMEGWSHVRPLINSTNRVLCSPLIAPLLIEQNREIFDDGQTEYFLYGAFRRGIWKNFLKEDPRVYMAMTIYLSKLEQMIQHKEFGLLVISGCPPSVQDNIKKFYKRVGEFLVYVPQDGRPYALSIWVPAK